MPSDSVSLEDVEQIDLLAQADSILLSLELQEPEVIEQQPKTAIEPKTQQDAPQTTTQTKKEVSNSQPWEIDNTVGTAANSITDLDRPLLDSKTVVANIDLDEEREVIKIEDYGTEKSAMEDFQKALTRVGSRRPLRIGVFGDSFIENDIITADLRENFQGALGGNGVGFVAFATPIAKYRQTIAHTFSDWQTYSIMSPKKTPEQYLDKFYVSGLLCIPEEGARVTMASTTFRKYTKQSTVARLLFINEKSTELRVTINDTLERVFRPAPMTEVQEIVISGNIEKLDMSVHNVDGFIGYGVVFEDRSGVCVDNYSVRGTSGLPLFKTNASINKSIDKMLGYDLIILQFGLNVMQADVLKYNSFSNSLSRIIKYVRSCFPHASVMLMGVGDRCHDVNGKMQTMQAVYGVIDAQKAAAQAEEAAFWSTFDAMGGENSMLGFVERKWAAKDHLHIGYGGGKYIASQMFKSLMNFDVEQAEDEPIEVDTAKIDTAEIDTLTTDSINIVDTLAIDTAEVDSMMVDSLMVDSLAIDTLAVPSSIESDSLDLNLTLDSLISDSMWFDLIEGDSLIVDSLLMDSLLRESAVSSKDTDRNNIDSLIFD